MVYYSEPNVKLLFLDNLVTELDHKNNLIIDFDTQLTHLKRSKLSGSEFEVFKRTDIFLPYEITFQTILDKITNYYKRDTLIVIDSLNGLIDYFGSYFYSRYNNNSKTKHSGKVTHSDSQHSDSQLGSSNQNAGYKAFSFLNILFRNQILKEMPIVITSYISQRSLDKLIVGSEKRDYDENVNRNHFRRFSNTVFCLGYLDSHCTLTVTVIKKRSRNVSISEWDKDFRPCSMKFNTK